MSFKKSPRFYLFALPFFISLHSHAALLNWTDPSPHPLQMFDLQAKNLAALTQQDIAIYTHPTEAISLNTINGSKNYNAQFSSAAVVLNVPMQQVADLFRSPQRFIGTFPTLTAAKIMERNATNTELKVKYHVSIPTPLKILNFNEDVIMQHRYDANSMTTTIIDSPFPIGVGKVQWFALDNNHTLVTLTQWADLNTINGFLVRTMLNAMPEAKAGIPYGVDAFVMEALKQKFNSPPAVSVLGAGAIPQKQLNAQQYQQVIKISQNSGQPVQFIHNMVAIPYQHGNENLRFTSSYQYYGSSPQKTAAFLNPLIYQQLFPRLIKSIAINPIDDRSRDVVIKGGAGLGVITIPFHVRMRAVMLNPQTTDLYAVGGDLRFIRHRMSVIPFGTGSVWQMSAALKVDAQAPYLLRLARSMPYHEMLPAATMARVMNVQAKTKLGL